MLMLSGMLYSSIMKIGETIRMIEFFCLEVTKVIHINIIVRMRESI